MFKVLIPLLPKNLKDGSTWPPFTEETLWVSADGAHYRIENIPFYSDDVSYQDVISASATPQTDVLRFRSVLQKSGHRKVRLILIDESAMEEANAAVKALEHLGLSWESGGEVVVVDVPPEMHMSSVAAVLKPFWENEHLQIELVNTAM